MNKEDKICAFCKYHFIEGISFDSPQSCCKKRKATTEKWLKCDDFEYSDRYIEALQQKVNQLEEKEELHLNRIDELTDRIVKLETNGDEAIEIFRNEEMGEGYFIIPKNTYFDKIDLNNAEAEICFVINELIKAVNELKKGK